MELNLAQVFGAVSTSMRAVNVKGPASILIMVMRRPLRRRWWGPSKRTALGAIANVGHTGSAAWHMLHRVRTIRSTSAKVAPGTSPVLAPRGPAADNNAIAPIPAAATPHTHHGDP